MADGSNLELPDTFCPPPASRPCPPTACGREARPSVPARQKVYVRWRKARKLHLAAGGSAHLLLRCPARPPWRGGVRWLKDGRPLADVPHVSVTPLGELSIAQVRGAHAGLYTCVVGPAREHVTLQVNSGRTKPLPDGDLQPSQQLGDADDVNSPTSKARSLAMVQRASADVAVDLGAPVLLQRTVSSLELRCVVLGSPQPSLSWTKDGKKVQQSGR